MHVPNAANPRWRAGGGACQARLEDARRVAKVTLSDHDVGQRNAPAHGVGHMLSAIEARDGKRPRFASRHEVADGP